MTASSEKVIVVTGATNGIGEAIALGVAKTGATTVVVSRSKERCEATVAKIKQATSNHNIHYHTADLSEQAEVIRVADEIKSRYDRLDVLVNNAGAWFTSRQLSPDGIEMTWALNHLNYFLLTKALLNRLKATAEQHGEARIINQSSDAHHEGYIHWDDVEFENSWDTEGNGSSGAGWGVYSQSKYANVVHAFGLARRLEGTGVAANAVHPGVVVTGFSQNNGIIYQIAAPVRRLFNRNTAEGGAQPAVRLAVDPAARGVSGRYFGPPKQEEQPKPNTRDIDEQDRLWELSERMIVEAVPVSTAP